jgi:hypothetical protein
MAHLAPPPAPTKPTKRALALTSPRSGSSSEEDSDGGEKKKKKAPGAAKGSKETAASGGEGKKKGGGGKPKTAEEKAALERKKELDSEFEAVDEVEMFLNNTSQQLWDVISQYGPLKKRLISALKFHSEEDVIEAREHNSSWLLHVLQNVILSNYCSTELFSRLKGASEDFDDERLGFIETELKSKAKPKKTATGAGAGSSKRTKPKTLKDLYRTFMHSQHPDLWPKKVKKAPEQPPKNKTPEETLDELIANLEKSGEYTEVLELYRQARTATRQAAAKDKK